MTTLAQNGMFDTTYALSSLYLWLLFGFLGTLINCDLQRMLRSSDLVRHLIAIVAFFFLFTVLDSNSKKVGLLFTWLKTLVMYVVFMLAIKSKWYFAVPVLLLLLVDQSIKLHAQHLQEIATSAQNGPAGDPKEAFKDGGAEKLQEAATAFASTSGKISAGINVAIIALVVIGFVQYGVLQYQQHGPGHFSVVKLLFGSGCQTDSSPPPSSPLKPTAERM
jgi:hypothetical protein